MWGSQKEVTSYVMELRRGHLLWEECGILTTCVRPALEITRQHHTTALVELVGWTCRSLKAIAETPASVSILVIAFDEVDTAYGSGTRMQVLSLS